MATFYGSYNTEADAASGVYVDDAPRAGKPGETISFYSTFTSTAALANADKVRFLRVPKGAKFAKLVMTTTDHDSGTTIQVKLGLETTDDDAFGSALTHLQDADTDTISDTTLAAAAVASADDWLTMTVTAGPATTTGTVTVWGQYFIP